MNAESLVKKLRALALEIETGTAEPTTRPASAPAPERTLAQARHKAAPAGSQTVEVTVGYWQVKDTSQGKAMGSLSPAGDGERVFWRVFDEKLILAVDPLQRGDRIRATITPWKDTYVVNAIERLGADPKVGNRGIDADEIPF
jgi:hypothetical protein